MTTEQAIDVSGLKYGLKLSQRKENSRLNRSFSVVDLTKRHNHEAHESIVVRTYWPGSVCYACVWIMAHPLHGNGSGKAGGCGYCKESAAIQAAFESAGIKFGKSFGAAGLSAVREFLADLARTLGLTDFVIVESHA